MVGGPPLIAAIEPNRITVLKAAAVPPGAAALVAAALVAAVVVVAAVAVATAAILRGVTAG